MTCTRCRGRGWTPAGTSPSAWPEACLVCRGRGRLTLFRLSRLLGVEAWETYRVARMQAGPRVAGRVFHALTKALPEVFR